MVNAVEARYSDRPSLRCRAPQAERKITPYGVYPRPSLQERLWSKVDKTESCWLWTGWTAKAGYGFIKDDGRDRPAHVVSFEMAKGTVPRGLKVLHRCDTPSCVNPEHLFLGTSTDNSRDMTSKGRQAFGEKQGNAKLTREDVKSIRRRYLAGGIRQNILASEYGVSRTTIYDVTKGKSWKWLL